LGDGVSLEFTRRFAGLDKAVVPERAQDPWVGRGRFHRPETNLRRLWAKIRDGQITDPVTVNALRRDHRVAFAKFDQEVAAV
jgi:hypothetical protein